MASTPEFSQTWKGKEGIWLGVKFWEEEYCYRAKVDYGNLGQQTGLVVGEWEPIQLRGGYYNETGTGFYAFLRDIDDALFGVHESKITKI